MHDHVAASRRAGGLDPLTARERDVLALMAQGRSNQPAGARRPALPAALTAAHCKLPVGGQVRDVTLS